MKSGKPLVLVVNRGETARRAVAVPVGNASPGTASLGTASLGTARRRSHLRLVSVAGVSVAEGNASGAGVPGASASGGAPSVGLVKLPRPPRSLSRPFGRRMVQVANDVAVLALALLAGLRPLA